MDTGHNPGPSGGRSAGRYRRVNITLDAKLNRLAELIFFFLL